jgi:hypothetical protein
MRWKYPANLFWPIPEPQLDKPFIWLGAVSFEERCIGSLKRLHSLGGRIVEALLIDYPTNVEPHSVDIKKRTSHRKAMSFLISKMACQKKSNPLMLHPYRLACFRETLKRASCLMTKYNGAEVIIDITCLTKAHTLGLASWLIQTYGTRLPMTIAYSSPEQYGTPARHTRGTGKWTDIVIAPCELEPRVFSEEVYGIILLGHEGSRLELALAQVPPQDALIILAERANHEEVQLVTRTANSRLLRQVISREKQWRLKEIGYYDIRGLQELILPLVKKWSNRGHRIMIYPFGPKPFILASSLAALASNPSSVWYCYPVPKSYDVDYTIGIANTQWFKVA